jgi:hypothetical protein
MKNSTVFAFLAGFATCAGALYGAGNHTPAIYFAAGALASSAALMALGWAFNRGKGSGRRHRRVTIARPRRQPVPAAPEAEAAESRRKCAAGTFKKTTAPATPLDADVISALKNFGASSKEARELAREAITAAGAGADFPQVMRLAVQRRAR